jgi:hypothetical protein
MRFPTIHSNGTSFKTLDAEYMRAYEAVDVALDALAKVTCHGRDYYVQDHVPGSDAAQEAFKEHHARLVSLAKVKAELMQIVVNINEQEKR